MLMNQVIEILSIKSIMQLLIWELPQQINKFKIEAEALKKETLFSSTKIPKVKENFQTI